MTTIFPVRAIALKFEYAESSKISWLIFHLQEQKNFNRKEAIQSLTEQLYQRFRYDLGLDIEHKECCKKSLFFSNVNFCMTCGDKVNKKVEIEQWHNYLYELLGSDTNSYGDPEEDTWTPHQYDFNIHQSQTLIIGDSAEHILTVVLNDLHPELFKDEFPIEYDECKYWIKEYLKDVLDEGNIYIEGAYQKPIEVEEEGYIEYSETAYSNGASVYRTDGVTTKVRYNTGDIVYLDWNAEGYVVTKVITSSGKTY